MARAEDPRDLIKWAPEYDVDIEVIFLFLSKCAHGVSRNDNKSVVLLTKPSQSFYDGLDLYLQGDIC